MVSMKDIALRCNVSVATVSKALSGRKDIGEDTRQRICKMADEMGYLSNAAARALKTNRTYNIGVLFVDEQLSGLTHDYFSAILQSFKVEAEKRGYSITFINRYVGTRKTTYLQHCQYRGLDGVLIASADFGDPEVLELAESQIPLVTIDHIYNNHTAIMSNNVAGMSELVRYVYEKGHRRLGMIHGEMTNVTKNRVTSFHRTCKELGMDVSDEYIVSSRYHDPIACAEATEKLLQLQEPPTCIFFSDDFSGMGGLDVIRKKGLRIPEDISVVGYDGIYLSQAITPHLTTCWQDTTTLGALSAEHLIRAIEEPKTTVPEQIMVSGRILEGDSVMDLNAVENN
ncbi:MAG: LacI family DNA-binding transcriptional regulator [Lachnospiraceae bacterium]|nr:LacI family DNA-binding transcriptional regulator [Lachnospiraceae bacterium]